jgi:hypothetical protein
MAETIIISELVGYAALHPPYRLLSPPAEKGTIHLYEITEYPIPLKNGIQIQRVV